MGVSLRPPRNLSKSLHARHVSRLQAAGGSPATTPPRLPGGWLVGRQISNSARRARRHDAPHRIHDVGHELAPRAPHAEQHGRHGPAWPTLVLSTSKNCQATMANWDTAHLADSQGQSEAAALAVLCPGGHSRGRSLQEAADGIFAVLPQNSCARESVKNARRPGAQHSAWRPCGTSRDP